MNKPKVINDSILKPTSRGDLRTVGLELPTGHNIELDYLQHPGGVCIVPFISPRTLLMIKEYKHTAGEYLLMFPAGSCNFGEDKLIAAKRELKEETGGETEYWKKLGAGYAYPSFSTDFLTFFFADGVKRTSPPQTEADELIEVVEVNYTDALDGIRSGDIKDCKTMLGLLLVQEYM